jgi:hypothetical protein
MQIRQKMFLKIRIMQPVKHDDYIDESSQKMK